MVAYDRAAGASRPLPESWRERIASFEELCRPGLCVRESEVPVARHRRPHWSRCGSLPLRLSGLGGSRYDGDVGVWVLERVDADPARQPGVCHQRAGGRTLQLPQNGHGVEEHRLRDRREVRGRVEPRAAARSSPMTEA